MKTLLVTLTATAALAAVAGPAAAQDWRDHDHDRAHRADDNINARQARLNERIQRGARDGSLTRWEARRLFGQSHDIARIEARYRVDGLSGWERADLDRRLDRLAANIGRERHDGDTADYRR